VPNKYDNYIQGNTGNNMVRYPEEMINYQITLGNPAVIKNKEMNADSDTLVSIEFIQFSDTIISN
jgi:hypothetical protein